MGTFFLFFLGARTLLRTLFLGTRTLLRRRKNKCCHQIMRKKETFCHQTRTKKRQGTDPGCGKKTRWAPLEGGGSRRTLTNPHRRTGIISFRCDGPSVFSSRCPGGGCPPGSSQEIPTMARTLPGQCIHLSGENKRLQTEHDGGGRECKHNIRAPASRSER